jgi:exopolyphosphatase/guanosine-5'-triphosphate,3'-diphosphate pyrophosphatase
MRILAAMDIGTNSVRLAVIELQPGGTWTTLASQKQVVRLGEGEFATETVNKKRDTDAPQRHRLTSEAIGRGALVCARFAEVARGFGADEIIALATAAVREADNKEDFVNRVRDLADLDVRVISGQEEARLIYLGVSSGIEIPLGQRALFMDIGGGSTELIVGDSRNYMFLDSLRLGAIRLTSEVVGDAAKPVSASSWSLLQRRVRSALAPGSLNHPCRIFGHVWLVRDGAEPGRDRGKHGIGRGSDLIPQL